MVQKDGNLDGWRRGWGKAKSNLPLADYPGFDRGGNHAVQFLRQCQKIDSENIGREPPDPATSMASIQSDPSEQNPFQAIEIAFEDKIKGVLENIVGVGTVDVMVTVDSTEELVVQRNVKDSQQLTEETDASGGKRHMTQYTRDGEIITYEIAGDQTPIVTKKLKPQIRGVLVVARGAENKVVKDLITDAVEKGLNVAAYRISVVPRKQD